jgi:hypothetical protein
LIARSFDDAQEKQDASVADRQGLGSAPAASKTPGLETAAEPEDAPSASTPTR